MSEAKDSTTVEDLMGDGPGPNAEDPQALFMQAVENDNNPWPQGYDSDGNQIEEVNDNEEVQGQGPQEQWEEDARADAQHEEEGQQEGQVDESGEDVTVSRDAYERILSMLGLEDEDIQAEKAPVKEEAPEVLTPPTQPLSDLAFKIPTDPDELLEIQTDPEKYAQHINALIQNTIEQTVAAMTPVVNERAGYIYQAMEFDKRFFEKHPQVPVKLAIKALATAQKTLGANASWDDLFVETEKNCAFAMGVAKSMKSADSRTNSRAGRFAPQTARKSRPSLGGPKPSPTDEVMSKITSPTDYDAQTVQLLRDVGTM